VESRQTVQLLTRAALPQWWLALTQDPGLDCEWIHSAEFNPGAGVVLVSRKELEAEFKRETFSPSKVYILFDESWTAQNLRRALSALRGALFFESSASAAEAAKVIQVALARQRERGRHAQLLQMMRSQNRQIEELNQDLEQTADDRTHSETVSRKASQKSISRVRGIITFIKDLAQLFDISDLLPLIRRQVKEHHALEAPMLFVPKGESIGDIYYLQGSQCVKRAVRALWIASNRIRIHQPEDSKFLANALGRPFGKVLCFPLITSRHQADAARSPLLFFEHRLPESDLEAMVSALSEKLQPVTWALDRLVLEQELKTTSRDWEMTFDELSEPIAIVDHDGSVLRSNSHWDSEFTRALRENTARIRFNEKIFTVERYPIRVNADSPPLSWVVYLRDETRSWKLKSQVIHVEKMSAIGQLAGHIAHELNNPLTGIRSMAQVLLAETAGPDPVHQDLLEVEKAASRCQGIINNLLDFSKGSMDNKVRMMDLNEVVQKTLPFLKSALGRLRTDISLSEEPLPVKVEPHLLQQVIFNLVNNACQALADRGEVKVRTFRDERWAMLEVEDNGPGIPNDLQERIFEPFFTTKSEGEGTGLGLSFSREFVRQFGGEISCDSKPGQGAVFRVQLKVEA
jgi:signal transduction histidine kinase